MSDYSQVNDYSAKDALATGNPLKLIKGSDVDQEFAAIAVAIASKFDSTDIATAGEAQAGVSNTVVITPARLTAWAQNDAGIVEDLQALSDPDADRILFWDDSAGAATFLTVGTGLAIDTTTISVDETGFARQVIAGEGLSGGGALSSDVTLDLDINELSALTSIAATDEMVFADADDSNISKKITFANFEASLSVENLTNGFDLATIVLTAGEGLSYSAGGTDLSASATIDLDITELTTETTIDATNDDIVFYDASAAAHRKVNINALVGSALGDGKWYKSTTTALTTTEQTVVFNTADNDSLQRGTFDTGTGQYTATATARILVTASMVIPSLGNGEAAILRIQKDGTDQATSSSRRATATNSDNHETVTTIVNMTAGQVMRIRAGMTSGTGTANSGIAGMHVSIVELG